MSTRVAFAFLLAGILPSFLMTGAEAVPIKWVLTHHGAHCARYCPFLGCCCLPSICIPNPHGPKIYGMGRDSDFAPLEDNVDAEILLDPQGGVMLHAVFLKEPYFEPGQTYFPIETPLELPAEMSNALGYERVTLLPGEYPHLTGRSLFGELYINATAESPIDGSTSQVSWTLLKSRY